LKDRRRSTKSPDTLSTLRYYCSQRADTAKPRKAEHPKAQNRYECAGALTIIIDLIKRTAHVTVIHKYPHPPFVSHHHHHHNYNNQNASSQIKQETQQPQQPQQQQQQQQQPQQLPPAQHQSPQHQAHTQSQQHQQPPQQQLYHQHQPNANSNSSSGNGIKHDPHHQQLYQLSQQLPPPLTIQQQAQQHQQSAQQQQPVNHHQSYKQQQQLQNLRILQQQQQQQQQQKRHQVDLKFDLLRQKVADVGQLLENQQTYGNKHFLKVATDAFSGANDLFVACKDNKYTPK
jgi:hypothetical protein